MESTRVPLAVIVPPALPSFGYIVGVMSSFLGEVFGVNEKVSGCCRLHLIGDHPNKPRQFACDRGGYHRGQLSGTGKLAVPAAQSFLGFPCDVADRLGELLLTDQLCAADPGRKPGTPGGLDQHAPCSLVASLGDTAWATCGAARVFRRNQAKKCHELSWLGEAGNV